MLFSFFLGMYTSAAYSMIETDMILAALVALQLGTIPSAAMPLSDLNTTRSQVPVALEGLSRFTSIVPPAFPVKGVPHRYTNTTTALPTSQTNYVEVVIFSELPVLSVTAQIETHLPSVAVIAAAQSSKSLKGIILLSIHFYCWY